MSRPKIITSDPVDRAHWHNRGKAAWWLGLPHLAGGGRFHDICGPSPGALVNTTAWGADDRGAYVRLDGVNQSIQSTSPAFDARGDSITWGCRVRVHSTHDFAGLAGQTYFGGMAGRYGIYLRNSGVLGVIAEGPSSTLNVEGGTTLLLDSGWHRAVASWDRASGVNLYLNGQIEASASGSTAGSVVSGQPFTVGKYNNSSLFLAADVDDVFLVRRAWSADMVRADFKLSRAGYPEGLRYFEATPVVLDTGGAPAAFLPAWATQSNQVAGAC